MKLNAALSKTLLQNVLNYIDLGQNIDMQEGVVYVSTDMKKTWRPLVNFVQAAAGNDEYYFLEYQLRLCSSLVKVRWKETSEKRGKVQL